MTGLTKGKWLGALAAPLIAVASGVAAQDTTTRIWYLNLQAPSVSVAEYPACEEGGAILLTFDAALVEGGFEGRKFVRVRRGGRMKTPIMDIDRAPVLRPPPVPAMLTAVLCGAFPIQRTALARWETRDGELGADLDVTTVGVEYRLNRPLYRGQQSKTRSLTLHAGPYDVEIDGEFGRLSIGGGGVPTDRAPTSGGDG